MLAVIVDNLKCVKDKINNKKHKHPKFLDARVRTKI